MAKALPETKLDATTVPVAKEGSAAVPVALKQPLGRTLEEPTMVPVAKGAEEATNDPVANGAEEATTVPLAKEEEEPPKAPVGTLEGRRVPFPVDPKTEAE